LPRVVDVDNASFIAAPAALRLLGAQTFSLVPAPSRGPEFWAEAHFDHRGFDASFESGSYGEGVTARRFAYRRRLTNQQP
jgi:hypothetical protein